MIHKITKIIPNNKKVGKKANAFRVSFKTRIIIFSIIVFLLSFFYILIGFNHIQAGTRKILARVGIYTEEIRSVEIDSSNYDDPGSWHVEKSAEWIGPNQAQVTFNVNSIIKTNDNYKDIILVLDVSGSMAGSKMNKALSDSKNLVEYLLEDQNNHVSVITFSNNSTILTPFSNDKDFVLSKLDIVATEDSTNYNAALLNVDEVMSDYVKQSDHDVVTLFLTDGYPNKDTPNQIATYTILKDKYPYMDINGIQYEMGKSVIEDLKRMTDAQWVADQDNLHNVLLEASISPLTYEKFVLTDYIDNRYFKVDSINDISVSKGNVTMNNNKITWNLENKYVMGEDMAMTIKMSLKEEYETEEYFYPTNTKTEITFKEKKEREKTSTLNDTPVLKNLYDVIYETNTPDGCTLSAIPKEQYFNYQRVNQKTDELTCEGYVFKGWEVVEASDLKRVNDDTFLMPGHDIHIRATWSQQSIAKTMNGNVHEKDTLYKVVKRTAETGGPAKEYTGDHNDSMDPTKSTEKIYYYSGNLQSLVDKNNVIFANHCWQMIRTTDTGGVKLLYNGEVENNQCLDDRSTHIGYNGASSQNMTGNYWYGTDYTYDKETSTFKVSGDTEQKTWNATDGPNLIGKYTCKLTEENGSCENLYYIESYSTSTNANTININSDSDYATYGNLQYNYSERAVEGIGYKYGMVSSSKKSMRTYQDLATSSGVFSSTTIDNSYWFADSIDWSVITTNSYTLIDPYQASTVSDYSDLVGKYTFLKSDKDYNSNRGVYYVVAVNDGTMYIRGLSNGTTLSQISPIIFGDSITDNGDGTYTLNNTEAVALTDLHGNYENYRYKYTCYTINDTCTNPRYIINFNSAIMYYIDASKKILIAKSRNGLVLEDTLLIGRDEFHKHMEDTYSDYKYTCATTSDICSDEQLRIILGPFGSIAYKYVLNYYFGSSITWDGTEYTLVDPIGLENYDNMEALFTHHYICLDGYGLKKCSKVGYIYYYNNGDVFQVVQLENGIPDIETLMNKMYTDNTTNSVIKNGVDAWYKKYLLNYSNYIEDTVFCNDRTINDIAGWDPNGGYLNRTLTYRGSTINANASTLNNIDLSCPNISDRFSVFNNLAKLDYPVALMTDQELSQNGVRGTINDSYFLMSPYSISNIYSTSMMRTVSKRSDSSRYGNNAIIWVSGVRPSISLVPGIEYIDGDGSRERPYYIDTE